MEISTFLSLVIGGTEIVKNQFKARGYKLGQWSMFLTFLFGGLGTYLMRYHLELWNAITPILLTVGANGVFSIGKKLRNGFSKE